MRSLFERWRGILAMLVMAAAILILGYTANVLFRPGCSLMPVAVPDDGSGHSEPISVEQACAVLGRPLPAADPPEGVSVTAVSVSTGTPVGVPRMVRLVYVKGGRNVATLDVARTGPPAGNVSVNNTLGTTPADVRVTHIESGNFDDVGYHWFRDDFMFTLHVQLVAGITRNAVDDMAASIR